MVIIMKNESLWIQDIPFEEENELNKNIKVDVLIIGGGITGISSAYFLKDSGLNIALVDRNRIGFGVTSRTTGKINYLQETVYSSLEDLYSFDIAKQYYDSQKEAINLLLGIQKKEKIDCNLEKVTSYVFTNKNTEVNKIKREKEILTKMGAKIQEHKNCMPLKSIYAISAKDTYIFHPLKYIYAIKKIIKKNIALYENTKVISVKKSTNYYTCSTNKGIIAAKKVIFACHYPFFIIPYFIPLKVNIEKSYIAASIVPKSHPITSITSTLPCKSIRYYTNKESFLLYLNNSHNLCNHLNQEKNYKNCIKETLELGFTPSYVWENNDMMTLDKMPYIGKIKMNNEDLLIACGYNTWGMTNGTIAGKLLSDIILEKSNNYKSLFNPLRITFTSNIKNRLSLIACNTKSFIGNKLIKNKNWYSNSVHFEKRNGKNVGIYYDEEGEHIVINKCPHMGCSLIFNEVEHTWDCPCHASRFDKDGKCIKGPSCYDISFNTRKKK